MDPDIDLTHRLRRLERRTRWLTAGLAGLVGLVLVAAAERPDSLRAGAFQLVDERGAVRAELKLDDGAPGLYLRDPEGRDRVALFQQPDMSGLYVFDDQQTVRIGVAQFAHGGGGVALHGPGSKGAAVLYLKGEGSLTFYDATGAILHRTPGRTEPAGEATAPE